ncbi:MAG: hypothetical protein CSYNP_00632 [Syntrophus sp. SKADARSKE-3]|nr:hypothetical protein [Syntrophus sp. SKADARSKE-3]
MSRRFVYLIYAALWVFVVSLYVVRPFWGNAVGIFVLYGLPVFALYGCTLLLMDIRDPVIDRSMIKPFVSRRRFSLGLFFFGMVVLTFLRIYG